MGWLEDAMRYPGQAAANVAVAGHFGNASNLGNLANLPLLSALPTNPGKGGQQGAPLMGSNAAARNADMEAGYAKGKELFYDDPDMQDLRNRRMDLSKGYNGQELGAMKSQAQSEIEGQRSNYLRSLSGNAAKAGVGGARAAAMKASADQGFHKNSAEMQRKMTLDNANLVRSGTGDLQDFMMRQKYGMLGTGLGYAQMGVADRSADAQAAIAGKEREKGPIGQLWDNTIGQLW